VKSGIIGANPTGISRPACDYQQATPVSTADLGADGARPAL